MLSVGDIWVLNSTFETNMRERILEAVGEKPSCVHGITIESATQQSDNTIRLKARLDDVDEISLSIGLVKGEMALENCVCMRCGIRRLHEHRCDHLRSVLWTYGQEGVASAIQQWLSREKSPVVEAKVVADKRMPLVEFEVVDDRLYMAFRRWEGTENDVSLSPGMSLTKTKAFFRKYTCESKQKRQAFERLLRALDEGSEIEEGRFLVPRISAHAMLKTACGCTRAIYTREGSFSDLCMAEKINLDYQWSVDEESYWPNVDGLRPGTTFFDSDPWVRLDEDGQVKEVSLPEHLSTEDAKLLETMPSIKVEDAQKVFEEILDRKPDFPLRPPHEVMELVDVNDSRLINVLHLSGDHECVQAELGFRYYRGVLVEGEFNNVSIVARGQKRYRVVRSAAKEAQALARLNNAGLLPIEGNSEKTLLETRARAASDDPEVEVVDDVFWARFLDQEVPRLVAEGWRVETPKKPMIEILDCPKVFGQYRDDADNEALYKLSLGIEIDGKRVSLLPLVTELLRQHHWDDLDAFLPETHEFGYLPLGKAQMLRMPTKRLRTILRMVVDTIRFLTVGGDELAMPLQSAGEVGLLDDQFGDEITWSKSGRVSSLIDVFNGFRSAPKAVMPKNILSTLEEYQLEGVSRMAFMAEQGFPVLLCDEMGLGKTLQLLALYALQKEKDKDIGPCLVMVSAAGLSQWVAQVGAHCPSLNVAQTGVDVNGDPITIAQRLSMYDDCARGDLDILVSTYDKIHRDIEAVAEIEWHSVYADEAQTINNPKSKMRKSTKLISARFRYPTTGTPIENNLMELWSLFDVALPGYLGNASSFSKKFARPIEEEQNRDALYRLKLLIMPFMRRKLRNDDDVQLNIPEPNKITLDVDIHGAQRDLYESVRVVQDKLVSELIKEKGLGGSQAVVIKAINAMRQIACDPGIYDLQPHKVEQSAKRDVLEKLLDEFQRNGTQAIVFSNYARMMPLFEQSADQYGLKHSVISGKVKNRDPIVSNFREGKIQVLFATLGTMNSSIDLFNAKAMVIYEPWWNPQKESQGIGRMVRRGQEDETTVYRLFAKDTVERHLLKIQDDKLALVDAIFREDIEALQNGLSEEDVRQLFLGSAE